MDEDKNADEKRRYNTNKKTLQSAGTGFIFMIAACVLYLIWWFINYYPDSPYSSFAENGVKPEKSGI